MLDHYGPDQAGITGGMVVPPHPHTGLQTVSWLFSGEVEHRDSATHRARIRPGELNLMTAGRGISHSEVSTGGTAVLLGGVAFDEPLVMWWNFVARSHEEIVAFRDQWQFEIGSGERRPGGERRAGGESRGTEVGFGLPPDDPLPALPAPALPGVRLRPRRR